MRAQMLEFRTPVSNTYYKSYYLKIKSSLGHVVSSLASTWVNERRMGKMIQITTENTEECCKSHKKSLNRQTAEEKCSLVVGRYQDSKKDLMVHSR